MFELNKDEQQRFDDFKLYYDGQTKYNDENSYAVSDLNIETAKILFILESPHKDEEVNKCPAFGDTGKAISKFVKLDLNKSIGEILKGDSKFREIGIINVSHCPLQDIEDNKMNAFTFLPDIQHIRTSETAFGKYRSSLRNKIEKYIYDDFARRLDLFSKIETLIVCGSFAKKYTNKYTNDYPKKIYKRLDVPHPSYNQWEMKSFKNLKELSKINFKKYTTNKCWLKRIFYK